VLANETNSGAVETFNRGLAQASGEFLVRLDADDMLTPGSLARAVAVLQALPDVGLVYGHPLHFSDDELPVARSEATDWYVWRGSDWLAARCVDGTNVITSPEVVMRRSIVDRVGGQRDLAHTHDMEMWLRIAAHADVAYVRGVDQAWHRDHPSSLSMKADDPLVILAEIRDAFDVLFESESKYIANADALHRRARQAVARAALDQAQRTLDRGQVTNEVGSLRAFAVTCDPSIVSLPLWRRQERRVAAGAGRLTRLTGAAGRARRRLRVMSRRRRWHESGVYERLSVVGGRGGE